MSETRKKSKDELCCAKCKSPVSENDPVCPYCGAIFDYEAAERAKQEQVVEVKHNIYGIPYNIMILLASFALSILITVFATVGKDATVGKYFLYSSVTFILAEILLYIYFLPSIIAIENSKPNAFVVFICNLLLGITVVGWFFALTFATRSEQKE